MEMRLLVIQQEAQKSFFGEIGSRFEEGGFSIMMFISIIGIVGIILLIKGIFFDQNKNSKLEKTIVILNSLGLFALVLGVFGQLLKLISTLDYLSAFEDTTPRDLADGLKITLLPTLFGAFIFLFTRFSTILLLWIKPSSKSNT